MVLLFLFRFSIFLVNFFVCFSFLMFSVCVSGTIIIFIFLLF